jgi:hypothetical protein
MLMEPGSRSLPKVLPLLSRAETGRTTFLPNIKDSADRESIFERRMAEESAVVESIRTKITR